VPHRRRGRKNRALMKIASHKKNMWKVLSIAFVRERGFGLRVLVFTGGAKLKNAECSQQWVRKRAIETDFGSELWTVGGKKINPETRVVTKGKIDTLLLQVQESQGWEINQSP